MTTRQLTEVERLVLNLVAGDSPEPTHTLDLEDAIHWVHNGVVRKAVEGLRRRIMITYDASGWVLTDVGQRELSHLYDDVTSPSEGITNDR